VTFQLAVGGLDLLVHGIAIRLAETDWNLRWFLCLRCGEPCRFIYLPELACPGGNWPRRSLASAGIFGHEHCHEPTRKGPSGWARQQRASDRHADYHCNNN
jgi:hypothetical protein